MFASLRDGWLLPNLKWSWTWKVQEHRVVRLQLAYQIPLCSWKVIQISYELTHWIPLKFSPAMLCGMLHYLNLIYKEYKARKIELTGISTSFPGKAAKQILTVLTIPAYYSKPLHEPLPLIWMFLSTLCMVNFCSCFTFSMHATFS